MGIRRVGGGNLRPAGGGGGLSRRGGMITWDHDGQNVLGFVVEVNGVEYDMGALTPVSGTTYRVAWPAAISPGAHTVVVYAVNADGRHASASVVLVKS